MKDASEIHILERLKKAANVTNDNELAVMLGLSRQSIAKARATKSVPAAWIPKASATFDVSTDWLFFGRGPMRLLPSDEALCASAPDVQPAETTEQSACPRCAELKKELTEERSERRELTKEVRQLWKENAALREELATLKERANAPSALGLHNSASSVA